MDQPPQRSWWGRHWYWVVPVGCLVPLLVCGGGFVLIFTSALGIIKSSDVYKDALSRAKQSPAVQAALGMPITDGFFINGSVNVADGSGSADLSVPLSGPNGSGTLHAVAARSAGKWTFSILAVEVQGSGERIDLLAGQ